MNLRFLALGRRSLKSREEAAKGRNKRRSTPAKGATRKARAGDNEQRDLSIWLNRSLVVFAVGVVMFAGTRMYQWIEQMPVEQIDVTGELEHVQRRAVQELVQQSLAGGFLYADLQAMRDKLEALPWVFEATVRRQWPSALQIHVVEQLPIARWGEDAFLNHQGGVFRPSDQQDWSSLPLLSGPAGSAPDLMSKYLRLIDILGPLDLAVRALSLDERGEIEARLEGDIVLVLGNEAFLERVHRFLTVYKQELAPHAAEIARVDLRYQTGLAVAFRDDSQVAGL